MVKKQIFLILGIILLSLFLVSGDISKTFKESSSISINFAPIEYKTGDFIVQSQSGIDSYYTVNFTHIENSSDIQITYCINDLKLAEAQSSTLNETTGDPIDSPYLNYQPESLKITKSLRIGKQLFDIDQTVNIVASVTTIMANPSEVSLINQRNNFLSGRLGQIGIELDPIQIDPIDEILEPVEVANYCTTIIADPYFTDKIEIGDLNGA